MNDNVKHPKHYENQAIVLEPIDFCEKLPFNEGNALKYCFRAGHKDGSSELEDLKKAEWYLLRAKEKNGLYMTENQENNFEHLIQFLTRSNSRIISTSANRAKNLSEPCFEFFELLLDYVQKRILELVGTK